MIRRKNYLTIGWITPTVGCFGAVREMVEVSNVLMDRGHKVYIYHPDGSPVKWLPSQAECLKLERLAYDSLDVLIGIVDWKTELYQDLLRARADVKAICLLGFSPTEQMRDALKGKARPEDSAQKIIADAMRKNFLILADSSWQVEWMKTEVGYQDSGPAFGGVNLSMFFPPKEPTSEDPIKIIYSGDPRDRKGTDTVELALEIVNNFYPSVEIESYWGKKFLQPDLVKFIQKGHIFLDAHRRAGWCNPVAEAIACGCVPVCTNIGASRDFAIHEQTALVVPVDDHQQMAAEAIRLIGDPDIRLQLRENGLKHIQNFSYLNVVPVLEKALIQKVHDKQTQPTNS